MTPRRPVARRGGGAAGDERLQQLLHGLKAVRHGDFSTRLPQVGDALLDEIAVVFNGMVDQLALFTTEVTRVAREVGTDGKLGGQASVPAVSGTWKDLTESVNAMAGNLTAQVRDIASVATAVANGDVQDTGIGIAEENLETIFGAFQQADGTTSRRYGGTGLGLSISRQVANLLGGEIRAHSKLGQGSTCALTLPVTPGFATGGTEPRPRADAEPQRRVLVVEGTDNLLSLLVREFVADLTGPGHPVRIESVTTPDEAVAALAAWEHRCFVLDASVPGASALTFLQRLDERDSADAVPVLAHPTRTLSPAQERLLDVHVRAGRVELLPSPGALRERFLALLSEPEPEVEPAPACGESGGAPGLRGRKVLLVDDDARNVLAIAGMLELHGMSVCQAPNGREGIAELLAGPDVDLVLKDVMMPEMDGYATTAAIREMPRFDRLPIIVVTAKAMAGDREKSLAAGASDYVTKPVDPGELLGCIGRWLPGDTG